MSKTSVDTDCALVYADSRKYYSPATFTKAFTVLQLLGVCITKLTASDRDRNFMAHSGKIMCFRSSGFNYHRVLCLCELLLGHTWEMPLVFNQPKAFASVEVQQKSLKLWVRSTFQVLVTTHCSSLAVVFWISCRCLIDSPWLHQDFWLVLCSSMLATEAEY